MSQPLHAVEVSSGQRFAFGDNWSRFLNVLNDERIKGAETALIGMLGLPDLTGITFLDVGSGSGLSSLVARRLGARVHSFDYDPSSVACTLELKRRYFPDDADWIVEAGSVLDAEYLGKLAPFDVVCSWGVLHHTGAMWTALANVAPLVAESGRLFVAIYNEQGWISRYWTTVKKTYARYRFSRAALLLFHAPYLFGARWLSRALSGRLQLERGMSLWYDMIDWVGGYPFEVARPEEILQFYRSRQFELVQMRTCGGRHGCNEFVFVRTP